MTTSTAMTPRTSTRRVKPLTITPFGRPRREGASRQPQRPSHSTIGASALRDARTDLGMFQERVHEQAAVRRLIGEHLDPIVPAVVSEPPRCADRRARGMANPVGDRRAVGAVLVRGDGARPRRPSLTLRGRVTIVGLLVGVVAGCSALTLGLAEQARPAESTQVVARSGETVELLAERVADGRDVGDVVDSIRAANGLAVDDVVQAGDVLVVPGS
ncbi:MAG: LysM peptidoglycan-binding domain-containing protein [Cumulibacter sp.]